MTHPPDYYSPPEPRFSQHQALTHSWDAPRQKEPCVESFLRNPGMRWMVFSLSPLTICSWQAGKTLDMPSIESPTVLETENTDEGLCIRSGICLSFLAVLSCHFPWMLQGKTEKPETELKHLWGRREEHHLRLFSLSMKPLFPGGSVVKTCLSMQETQVQSLGREDSLKKEMATHSSILAWRIPCTEEPGGLQSTWPQESDVTELLKQQQSNLDAPWSSCVTPAAQGPPKITKHSTFPWVSLEAPSPPRPSSLNSSH